MAIAATIANHPRVVGPVVMAGPASTVEDRVSPAAAILGAVLHGAGALVLTDPLFEPPGGGLVDDEDCFDENDQPSRRAASPWRPSISGERALTTPAPRSDRRGRAGRPRHRAGTVRGE